MQSTMLANIMESTVNTCIMISDNLIQILLYFDFYWPDCDFKRWHVTRYILSCL